ncbi:MAG: F0F1 ATP synthase subunit delta [Oscillospiraceae bacterium]|jgi:F0F1-type ATP synthase delta subunit|nr:F0F1 ATP synthase subunit delta [Oscillospiraceae bacterium]
MSNAILRSAEALDAEALANITQQFEAYLGKTLTFEVSVDPNLIGGFVALIGGKLFDLSVAAQLAQLKTTLQSES